VIDSRSRQCKCGEKTGLRGRVRFPTGGESPRASSEADQAVFLGRQSKSGREKAKAGHPCPALSSPLGRQAEGLFVGGRE
jgi:hypothetical protein